MPIPPPWVFIAFGIALVWLSVLMVAVALCRAAAMGDEQLAQVIDLEDYRNDWGDAA